MKRSNSQSFDWTALIKLIGLLIKFLFEVRRDYKNQQSQNAQD